MSSEIRQQGRQDRKTQRQQANLELRNKAFDIMMQDDETKRFMIDTAKDSYSTAKKVLKIGGLLTVIGVGAFFAVKGIRSWIDSRNASQRIDTYTEGYNADNRTYKDVDYNTWADNLYRIGFNQGDGSWWQFGVVSYNDTLIREIIGKLKNADDWKALVKAFGTKEVKRGTGEGEKHDLPWFLSQDTSGTITKKDYQEMIKNYCNVTIEL